MIPTIFFKKVLTELPAPLRVFCLIFLDSLLLPSSVWLSFWFRFSNPFPPSLSVAGSWMMFSSLFVGLPLYAFTGQYNGLTRYVGSVAFYRLALRNGLIVIFLLAFGLIFRLPMPPSSSWILWWVLLTCLTGLVRFALRDLLINLRFSSHIKQLRVAIYGAGEAGAQLAAALRLAGNHKIVTFLDDNSSYWNRSNNGIPIQPPQVLNELSDSVDQVLLAIPSLTRSARRRIVEELQLLDIGVLQVPSVDDLTSGRSRIDTLRNVAIEDLLGRDEVPADPQLLGPGITGAVVCVTGAGGSIGAELCRKILALSPSRLILLERSEPSLYTIEQELRSLVPEGVFLHPVLCSANDSSAVQNLFSAYSVDLVFHAAAYKHVPLVEVNPLAALANNVGSTFQVCRAAEAAGVRQVVLISTDKAVRPTNVMGASKRLAELVVQAFAAEATTTRFSMVRFGNVLGSSGSVVPLFRRQIAAGGPITLTHPEIIRYFMTISEAATLVLQSSVLSQGGDLFLLDMGEPVRIKALAEQMVRLSGLTLRDAAHPDGDIEIICTGLRPGEKLYEELLIDAESNPTIHPLIYRAQERSIPSNDLWPQLDAINAAISVQDVHSALNILSVLVPEWRRASS